MMALGHHPKETVPPAYERYFHDADAQLEPPSHTLGFIHRMIELEKAYVLRECRIYVLTSFGTPRLQHLHVYVYRLYEFHLSPENESVFERQLAFAR